MNDAMSQGRDVGLDVGRGVLLLAMLAVHVISAHGSAGQVDWLHGQVGVFLISSGFVGLSGYVVGLRARGPVGAKALRGLDRGLQLLLVMFGYGVLLSLARHGLSLAGGGAAACSAQTGWIPPLRFDDLGILLPIALVQVFGPTASMRGRLGLIVVAVLALGWMSLPWLTQGQDNLVVDVLTRRSLTPFYTVTTFVAVGLVGVLLGRLRPRILDGRNISRAGSMASLVTAVILATPPVSRAAIDPIYRVLGELGGSAATLSYWSVVLILFLRGFAVSWIRRSSAPREVFALLGRNSLLTFVLHDFLLVLDAFGRDQLGLGKGLLAVSLLFAVNAAALVLIVRLVERSDTAQKIIDAILLGRSRRGSLIYGGALSIPGAFALAGILAVYTSAALARPGDAMVIDDFERQGCPTWWTFGFVPQERVVDGDNQYLEVRGPAPGAYGHGRGVFLDRDVGSRRTLAMRIAGDGPGSGRIKIELSEDDNGNWEIEKQPPLYIPESDDRLTYELSVDWRGWREIRLPIETFRDDNPGRGNDVFDPARDLTSGGLLELQLLFSPSGAMHDDVRVAIDDIRFLP